eukprot:835358-Amphidinium_carterae.1
MHKRGARRTVGKAPCIASPHNYLDTKKSGKPWRSTVDREKYAQTESVTVSSYFKGEALMQRSIA